MNNPIETDAVIIGPVPSDFSKFLNWAFLK